jgi:ABC-type transport system involved in multi-copper enzyme maturation permease subunit
MATTRTISPASQVATIYATDLKRLLRAKKTLVLLAVQLLPVLFALVYVFFDDIDGLAMFSETVERVMFPLLIPLAAVFYGGPVLVDEMEGRTLTYLTLRPVPKAALFTGKWLAGTTVAAGLVLVPVVALLLIVMIASGGAGSSFGSVAQIIGATVLGAASYTAIFALLGALAAKSLFPGIIYYVVFELICPLFPILELFSVRFHMRTAAGFNAAQRLGFLDKLIFDEPLDIAWWVGTLVLGAVMAGAVGLGAAVFSTRQYHIK